MIAARTAVRDGDVLSYALPIVSSVVPEDLPLAIAYEDDDLLSLSHSSKDRGPLAEHLVFWPASLVVILALGAGGVVTASRRLRVPTGRLPRGVRLA